MGESARDEAQWLPNALSFWELHLCESCKCSKPWLERKTNTKLGPQDTTRRVLNLRCLKCLLIVHLDLICMSYDKKKVHIGLPTTNPLKRGSNEVPLERAIHHWKDILKGYKMTSSCFQNKDFIWKRYEHQKFWDTWKFRGKVTFRCSPHGDAHNIL
jgi:hypothetical protein